MKTNNSFIKIATANILIFFSMLSIVVVLAEGYYRYKDSLAIDSINKSDYKFWEKTYPESSPDIYTLKPGSYRRYVDGSIEEFQVSEEGYRQINFDIRRPIDLVVYGDSFTFGHGVSEGKRFTDILARNNKDLNIANFAYNAGFTTPHYLLHYNNNDLDTSKIWVFTYLGNDCQSDIEESVIISHESGGYPIRTIKNGVLHGDRSDYPEIVRVLSDNSAFMRRIFSSVYLSKYGSYLFSKKSRPNSPNDVEFDMGYESVSCADNIRYIKNIERSCKIKNKSCEVVNFLIPQDFFVYPHGGQITHTKLNDSEREVAYKNGELFNRVIENCEKYSVNCINLLPILKSSKKRLYFNSDAHWNEEGHSIIADFLEAKIR